MQYNDLSDFAVRQIMLQNAIVSTFLYTFFAVYSFNSRFRTWHLHEHLIEFMYDIMHASNKLEFVYGSFKRSVFWIITSDNARSARRLHTFDIPAAV